MPISFHDVYKSFGQAEILRGVDIQVQDAECFFIIGASGAGKSVLIKQLIGLLHPDRGQIFLDGEDITDFTETEFFEVRKRCAMVFQNSTLFDSLDCLDNVALPLRKHKHLEIEAARSEATQYLEQVQMQEFAHAFPAELGDGMRKRVAIARALTLQPKYVLFDEPTTSLDPVSARRVDRMIRRLSSDLGVTCIVVSHDLISIFSIADRIAMLYQGQVRLLGTPEDFSKAGDPVVQQFINGQAEGPMEV
ncbi:MAG: ATP-binding cassette domain-containing protein [Myxococcota bacterium]